MNSWKDKFVVYTLIVIMIVVFVLIVLGLDKHSQPSIEDVMTNNANILEEINK